MRGRVRGKESTSINSCYITSFCWCQVAERKERKESAMTLFFSVVRPHLALLPLRLIPLRVCLYGYRRVLCLANTTGGSLRCSSLSPLSLSLLHPPLLLSLRSLLDHHVLLHPWRHSLHLAAPVLAFQVLPKHRWCLETAALILSPAAASKRYRGGKHGHTSKFRFSFFWLTVRRNLTYISKETMKWKFAVMCVFTVVFHPRVQALSLFQWLTPSTKVGSVLRNRLFKKKKKKKTFSVCCHRWKLSLPDNIINNSYMTNTFTSQPPSDKRTSTEWNIKSQLTPLDEILLLAWCSSCQPGTVSQTTRRDWISNLGYPRNKHSDINKMMEN